MEHIVLGIIEIVVGGSLAIFRRQFTHLNAKFQKDNFNIDLGNENNKATAWSAGLVGIILFGVGVLTLLGVVKW